MGRYSVIDITPEGDTFYESVEKCKNNWAIAEAEKKYPETYGTIDGVSDEVQINLAIAACAGARSVVELTAAQYTISASIIMDQDNVTLRSFNKSVIKIVDSADIDRMVYLSGDNCLIEGIKFDGNLTGGADGSGIESTGDAVTVNTFEARYNEFVDIGEYGFQLYGIMTDFSIHHNRFVGSSKTMISFQLSTTGSITRADVSHNYLNNSEIHGIQFYTDNTQAVSHLTVIGNTIIDCDDTGSSGVGIEININTAGSSSYVEVANNIIQDVRSGISLGNTKYLSVSGNVIHTASSWGIEIGSGGGYGAISNNEIYAAGVGIEGGGIDGFVISNNHIEATTATPNGDGMRFDPSYGAVTNTIISGNAIIDPKAAGISILYHASGENVSLTNNMITYETARTSAPLGFRVDLNRVTISGNTVMTSVGYAAASSNPMGVYVATANEVEDIWITNNNFIGVGSTAIDHVGIRVGTTGATNLAHHVYILNNVFENLSTANYLIRWYPGNPYLMFRGNEFNDRTDSWTLYKPNAPVTGDRLSASPTGGGLWKKGDIVWNSAPSSGNPMGWQCIDFIKTTTSGDEASGQTVISVTDATGMASGDNFSIELDDGDWHHTTINGAPAGNDVTITAALPSAAASGNEVITSLFGPMADLP